MFRSRMGVLNRCGSALAAVALCCATSAQTRLTPDQLNARKAPDYSPSYAGRMVQVQGVVSGTALHFPGYSLLAFEQAGHGAILDVPETDRDIDIYKPGDEIAVDGTVSSRAGMPTILPARIQQILMGYPERFTRCP